MTEVLNARPGLYFCKFFKTKLHLGRGGRAARPVGACGAKQHARQVRGAWRGGRVLAPEVLLKGESCNARSPLVS